MTIRAINTVLRENWKDALNSCELLREECLHLVDLGFGVGVGTGFKDIEGTRGSMSKDMLSAMGYISLVFLKIN